MICFSKAARFGRFEGLLYETKEAIRIFEETCSCGDLVFLAGSILRVTSVSSDRVRVCDLKICAWAVEMFDFWTDSARDAIVTWVLCAKRLPLHKDVRKMISLLLWDSRKEALHSMST